MENENLIFVYGTLRRGLSNHAQFLSDSEYIGTAKTVEKYAMYADGIPYVVTAEPHSIITGEVYRVNEQTLAEIDRLEGHPDYYFRVKVEIILMNRERIMAWLYFCREKRGVLLKSGDFLDQVGENSPQEP
ncbi:gamma-glutamylcyclotransferase family protein [Candidatus Riflebacteria bacterium]